MRKLKIRMLSCVGAAGIALVTGSPAVAGSSWLSTVTTVDNGRAAVLVASRGDAFSSAASSATSVFNITISLEQNPAGDNIYPDDAGSSDDEQNRFEAKVEEFADAVFQMTNSKHKIGRVTIFRDSDQANNADVQWIENCPRNAGPRAHPSGFGVAGRRIYYCTNWPGASSLMDTPKGAGFTLAHEWSHYAYGVYDEYIGSAATGRISSPRSTDTPSVPSIMNNQWNAARAGGDQDFLEYSTEGVEPYATQADGDDRNAHARVFEENGWATLSRGSGTDPRHSFLPSRTQYTNLVAPGAGDLTVNDNESSARSELDIVWAGDQVVELMIDVSGSMRGTPINNARTAASLLVGQLTPGSSAVGVGSFNSTARQVFSISDIPDPDTGVRAAAQAAIAGLSAGGGTNIETAAQTALTQTQSFQGGTRPSVVFLLTDGQSSINTSNVINSYVSAGVPLITFGFGNGVDATLLQNLANGTGGQYFFSPTSLAQIQQAFVAANAAVSSSTVVASSSALTAGSTTDIFPLPLDSTLADVSIVVTYSGSEADMTFRLLDPNDADTGIIFVCNAGAEVSCEATVDIAALGAGLYSVEATNNASSSNEVALLVSGNPSGIESYDIAVDVQNVSYPESFSLNALVSRGAPVSGLDVTAIVTRPDGTDLHLDMFNDGSNSDLIAGDGVYSRDIPYTQNGTYTVVVTASNAAGSAQTTNEGLAISVQEDGSPATFSPVAIPEDFSRVAIISAAVSNFSTDDHANDPEVSTSCTAVADDNLDTLGRIDSVGDVDCFFFAPSELTSDLVVRVTSLREDMQPLVRIYSADGTTELLTQDLEGSANSSSGVIIALPSSLLDGVGHVIAVEHADTAAESGGYAVSIGARLASDVVADGEAVNNDSDGDTVLDVIDFCPATAVPEETVPSRSLRRNRYVVSNDSGVFESTSRQEYTLADTRGCSCEQILTSLNDERYGCRASTLRRWIRSLPEL